MEHGRNKFCNNAKNINKILCLIKRKKEQLKNVILHLKEIIKTLLFYSNLKNTHEITTFFITRIFFDYQSKL